MTERGFHSLPNELLLQIASDADDSSLLSLLLCNTTLHTLLTPVLHTRAVLPRGPQTAMQWAAAQGHLSLVKFLIARGVHPDDGASNEQSPALQAAVFEGRIDMVELLVSNGADVNGQNDSRQSTSFPVIHHAAAKGDVAMIKLLAAHGAHVGSDNIKGAYIGTPLHMAVIYARAASVRVLLDLGAPVDTEDSNGDHPLDLASQDMSEDPNSRSWRALMVGVREMLVNAGGHRRGIESGV